MARRLASDGLWKLIRFILCGRVLNKIHELAGVKPYQQRDRASPHNIFLTKEVADKFMACYASLKSKKVPR
jgi:hypothetical protein